MDEKPYRITCKQCDCEFYWNTPTKKYCQKCLKKRDRNNTQKYAKQKKAGLIKQKKQKIKLPKKHCLGVLCMEKPLNKRLFRPKHKDNHLCENCTKHNKSLG